MTDVGTILVVDDDIKNRRLLEVLLQAQGYVTRSADDGPLAISSAIAHPPDLVLLDIRMPGMDGYEVAAALKANPALAAIPVIMLSAQTDREARLAGLAAGAEEILTKPVDRTELYFRVRNLLRLKRLTDELEATGALLQQEIRVRSEHLDQLSRFDELTGLPNRTLFLERLADAVVRAEHSGAVIAVISMDLDLFKNINDSLGHAAGDLVLSQVANRLRQCGSVGDVLGRLGGDEFALMALLEGGSQGAVAVANRIRALLQDPFVVEGRELSVTASMGIALSPTDGRDPHDLVQHADTAMYRAKEIGRDAFQFFVPQMHTEVRTRLDLDAALRRAVDNDELVLHYQPKVDLLSGKVVGVEALLRWQRPGHGLVPPAEFIPALEGSGLMVRVGSWVIDQAARQIKAWSLSDIGPMPIAINVSGRQFADDRLSSHVLAALRRHGVPPRLLEIELTESILMSNTEQTIRTLRELRAEGIRVSIDDFGTGYSSLAYLRSFPIDVLKVDRQFVTHVAVHPGDGALAVTIIQMAHSLGLLVIAEGIETAAQLQFLRHHGCDQMQGYYFSRPLDIGALEALLASGADLADEVALLPSPGTGAVPPRIALVRDLA